MLSMLKNAIVELTKAVDELESATTTLEEHKTHKTSKKHDIAEQIGVIANKLEQSVKEI